LTWDETPHERMAFMARDFSKDELADQDLRDYVASDTDSDGTLLVHLSMYETEPVSTSFLNFPFLSFVFTTVLLKSIIGAWRQCR